MPFISAILFLLVDAYAVLCLWREKATPRRTTFWLILILLLPLFGALIYLFFFRREASEE